MVLRTYIGLLLAYVYTLPISENENWIFYYVSFYKSLNRDNLICLSIYHVIKLFFLDESIKFNVGMIEG